MARAPTYTLGRLCAVVTRPLCLFVANNWLLPSAAQGLAIAFLASALAIVAIAAGPERRFYAKYFSAHERVNGVTFYLYVASLAVLLVLGVFVSGAIALYSAKSLPLAAATAVYFISEKFADELLRLRLFERDFAGWGRSSIWRAIYQLAGFGFVLLALGRQTSAWPIVLLLTLGNFAVFLPQLPRELAASIRGHRRSIATWLVARAVRSLARNWLLWAIALLSAAVAYLDRLVALIVNREVLPLFMLVVTCFSMVAMAVDFYYLSRHRRDFLERKIPAGQALASRGLLLSAAGGLAAGAVACAVALLGSHNGGQFPLGYIVVIAVLQVSTAIASIPREILYWSHLLKWILRVELVFWGLFALTTLLSHVAALPAIIVFMAVAACAVVRLALYTVLGRRTHATPAHVPEPGNP